MLVHQVQKTRAPLWHRTRELYQRSRCKDQPRSLPSDFLHLFKWLPPDLLSKFSRDSLRTVVGHLIRKVSRSRVSWKVTLFITLNSYACTHLLVLREGSRHFLSVWVYLLKFCIIFCLNHSRNVIFMISSLGYLKWSEILGTSKAIWMYTSRFV